MEHKELKEQAKMQLAFRVAEVVEYAFNLGADYAMREMQIEAQPKNYAVTRKRNGPRDALWRKHIAEGKVKAKKK